MIEGERIMVLGGAGSIGSELIRQLAPYNAVYVFDNNETGYFDLVEELKVEGRVGDIRNKETLKEAFNEFRPTVVIHAAALKHVYPSMLYPREYVETNIVGTLNVLDVAKEYGARVINVSTDKTVSSDSVMGWSKKGTELFTKIYGGVSVRFGNVMGSRGSVLSIFQRQLDSGKPLTVTDARAERYMMTIQEACTLLIRAAKIGKPGDTVILEMGERINILELAKKLLGKEDGIEMIGLRPGEALVENIMTPAERAIARKEGDFWIL